MSIQVPVIIFGEGGRFAPPGGRASRPPLPPRRARAQMSGQSKLKPILVKQNYRGGPPAGRRAITTTGLNSGRALPGIHLFQVRGGPPRRPSPLPAPRGGGLGVDPSPGRTCRNDLGSCGGASISWIPRPVGNHPVHTQYIQSNPVLGGGINPQNAPNIDQD
jgi:hypothetical protein